MQLRAAATFQSRYGFIRTGEIFTAEETYGQQLVIGGKATRIPAKPHEPTRRQVIPEAPQKKEEPTSDDPPPLASANLKDDGPARRSRSSRRVQVPPGPTPSTLVDAPKRSR